MIQWEKMFYQALIAFIFGMPPLCILFCHVFCVLIFSGSAYKALWLNFPIFTAWPELSRAMLSGHVDAAWEVLAGHEEQQATWGSRGDQDAAFSVAELYACASLNLHLSCSWGAAFGGTWLHGRVQLLLWLRKLHNMRVCRNDIDRFQTFMLLLVFRIIIFSCLHYLIRAKKVFHQWTSPNYTLWLPPRFGIFGWREFLWSVPSTKSFKPTPGDRLLMVPVAGSLAAAYLVSRLRLKQRRDRTTEA